jgi:nucleoside 2-deoxyribosyltransferase
MTKGRIYIACRWTRKDAARAAAALLTAAGYQVTASWIDSHGDTDNGGEIRQQAEQDVKEIKEADFFMFLNHEEPSEGKSFELGLAFGWGKPILFVGPLSRYNVFYFLPGVCHWQATTVEQSIKILDSGVV